MVIGCFNPAPTLVCMIIIFFGYHYETHFQYLTIFIEVADVFATSTFYVP